jgi:hypothetical protein
MRPLINFLRRVKFYTCGSTDFNLKFKYENFLYRNMSQVNVDKIVVRAKSFGLNVFFGRVDSPFLSHAFWDEKQGDYVKFLKLAKDSGASIVIVDVHMVEADDIDGNMINTESISDESELKRAKELNSKLESFRQYIGMVASVDVTWISNNVAYIYSEYAPWADEFYDLLYEIERVTRVPLT